MTIRIYGARINEWHSTDEQGRDMLMQIEREYHEYDSETGELVGCGTEDIPVHRSLGGRGLKLIETTYLYTWDGERRNKGGYRWFEYRGMIQYRGGKGVRKALKELKQRKYPEAVEIELRGR